MTATDLLRLAGALTDTEVNRLAHALGWPDLHQLRGPHSPALLAGIRWGNPYRNHYSCGRASPWRSGRRPLRLDWSRGRSRLGPASRSPSPRWGMRWSPCGCGPRS